MLPTQVIIPYPFHPQCLAGIAVVDKDIVFHGASSVQLSAEAGLTC